MNTRVMMLAISASTRKILRRFSPAQERQVHKVIPDVIAIYDDCDVSPRQCLFVQSIPNRKAAKDHGPSRDRILPFGLYIEDAASEGHPDPLLSDGMQDRPDP